jgi:hypothetical protein
MRLTRAGLALAAVAMSVLPVVLPAAPASAAGRVFAVAPTGSDAAAGTLADPWRSVAKAMAALRAGDTLYLRGGVYEERIGGNSVNFLRVSPGLPDARVSVLAYPGERPVIRGLLWLRSPDFWTVSGVHVTWSDRNAPDEHMVRIKDGRGWVFENAEVWGARSYANINVLSTVAGLPADWSIRNNCIHDNVGDPGHGTTRDQLLYIHTGTSAGAGTIERNLLFNAPRGKGIKLAGPDPGTGSANVVVRHNTVANTYKPGIVVGWATTGSQIYRNLVVGTRDKSLIRGYQLTGAGNRAWDNAGFAGPRVVASDSGYPQQVADLGGNVLADPRFDSTNGCGGFRPGSAAVAGYGHLAP